MSVFYPANRHTALAVDLYYSTNSEQAYIYQWLSSQILMHLYPGVLQQLSLNVLRVNLQQVNISIGSFCSNISDYEVVKLMNNTTIWVRTIICINAYFIDETLCF